MVKLIKYVFVLISMLSCGFVLNAETVIDKKPLPSNLKRVPAEWEPQEAIWLQWPGRLEKDYEEAIAKISDIISRYQTLQILYSSNKILKEAKDAILSVGADPENPNIRWQAAKYDNSWIRDNGPVYVVEENKLRIQNWKFNAWGGGFGTNIPFYLDNSIPDQIGKILEMPVDHIDIVHERGNLEFNGLDTVMLNWSTIGDPNRNAGYTKEQLSNDLKQYFGVSKVVLIEGIPQGDRTRGHIDGIARFINVNTVVVLQCTTNSYCKPDSRDGRLFDKIGETIEAAGFNVIREPIESYVEYNGRRFDTNYVNWLVGNGFVIAPGFGNTKADSAAKSRIENYFPNRDVHIVEMLNSWAAGGGVHCHTNDQPAQSILK